VIENAEAVDEHPTIIKYQRRNLAEGMNLQNLIEVPEGQQPIAIKCQSVLAQRDPDAPNKP
jgi:hypothetical protein